MPRIVGDACAPKYHCTSIVELEHQRELLGLALVGQVATFGLRIVTGHLSGGVFSLLVVVLGNNARCSLDTGTLSGFAMVGCAACALDISELIHSMLGFWGFNFIVLPFQANLAHNLTSISAVLSPVTQLFGVWCAIASMTTTEMLRQQIGRDEPFVSSQMSGLENQVWLSLAPSVGIGDMFGGMLGGSNGFWSTASVAPSCPPQRFGLASNGDARNAMLKPSEPRCAECRKVLPKGNFWQGTGVFTECFYCYDCWVAWTEPENMGQAFLALRANEIG